MHWKPMLSQIFCNFSEMCVHKPYVCVHVCGCMCACTKGSSDLLNEGAETMGWKNMIEKLPAKETSFLLKSPYILKCH